MKLDPTEQRLGYTWFMVAGTIAVLFAFTLYKVDSHLHTSNSEKLHAEKMRELRTAQTSLSSRTVDTRQNQEASFGLRVVTNADAEKLNDLSNHHQ